MSLSRLGLISLLVAIALTAGSMFHREGAGLYNYGEAYCANQPGCVAPDQISHGWPYPIVTLSAHQDSPSNYLQYLNFPGLLEDFGLAFGLCVLLVLFASRIPRIWRFIRYRRPAVGSVLLRSLIAAPLLVLLSAVVIVVPPPPSQCNEGILDDNIIHDACLAPVGHRGWPLPVSTFYNLGDSLPSSLDDLFAPGILLDLGAAFVLSIGLFSIAETRTGASKPAKKS
jgi:hypothetical protein